MSSAIAAARKRRAGIQQNDPIKNPLPPSSPQQSQPSGQPGGLTLPQVIALVDKRLVILEKFMSEAKVQIQESKDAKPRVRFEEDPIQYIATAQATTTAQNLDSLPSLGEVNEILDDYHNRFIILTQEITDLKDVILKLQSYTMDVNKMLVEERVLMGTLSATTEEPEQAFDVYDPIQSTSLTLSETQTEEQTTQTSTEEDDQRLTYNPNITHTLEPIEEEEPTS